MPVKSDGTTIPGGYDFKTVLADGVHTPVSRIEFNSPAIDAFGRLRVGNPETLFDSKQIFDNQPLFWDDAEESGSGTSSTHSANAARTRMGVSLNTAGKRTRQTFMRFNYQPGKSQLILLTGVLTSTAAAGVSSAFGYFDDDNGIFLKQDGLTCKLVTRSNVTGTPVDTEVPQSDWNTDTLDGSGSSGVTLDLTQTQILFIDFEWLGVGQVRTGFVVDGEFIIAHKFMHANVLNVVYMSTPNLPLRYQIENDGTGPATTMDHICSTVISEGGMADLGVLRWKSTNGTHVDANTADVHYALIGIRLKTTALGATVKMVNTSIISETNDDFEWTLRFNPTVAGSPAFADETNSSVQTVIGATANTVTGGTIVGGGLGKSSSDVTSAIGNAIRLGSAIDGTRDEVFLCVRPLSSNADYEGGLTWRELQ